MKSIYDILVGIGLPIPDDKRAAFDKEWKENYRTKAEYDNAVAKRDEYKQSLEGVQTKLDGFKDINVDDLKGQISTLTQQLQAEKDGRAADARKVELEKNVDSFMGGKKFVNNLTAESIRGKLIEALDQDSAKGKSVEDIFNGLITGEDGKPLENILIDESQQRAQLNQAQFTTQFKGTGTGGTITKDDFRKMTLDERIKLKQEQPDLYKSLSK